MNKSQIIAAIRSLAMSKGFYGRLLCELETNPEALDYLEAQNFFRHPGHGFIPGGIENKDGGGGALSGLLNP